MVIYYCDGVGDDDVDVDGNEIETVMVCAKGHEICYACISDLVLRPSPPAPSSSQALKTRP